MTTLQQNAVEIIAGLQNDQQPILIARDGRPVAYLVGVDSYETMQQRLAILERIAEGESAIAEGNVVSHMVAKAQMARWLD
jgi:prevent-host-death family protein